MNEDKDIYEGHRIDPEALAIVRRQIETENRIKDLLCGYLANRKDCTLENLHLWLFEDGYCLRKEQLYFLKREMNV